MFDKFIITCMHRANNIVDYYSVDKDGHIQPAQYSDIEKYPVLPMALVQAGLDRNVFTLTSDGVYINLNVKDYTLQVHVDGADLNYEEIISTVCCCEMNPVAFKIHHPIRYYGSNALYIRTLVYSVNENKVVCSHVSSEPIQINECVSRLQSIGITSMPDTSIWIPHVFYADEDTLNTCHCKTCEFRMSFEGTKKMKFSYNDNGYFDSPLDCFLRLKALFPDYPETDYLSSTEIYEDLKIYLC